MKLVMCRLTFISVLLVALCLTVSKSAPAPDYDEAKGDSEVEQKQEQAPPDEKEKQEELPESEPGKQGQSQSNNVDQGPPKPEIESKNQGGDGGNRDPAKLDDKQMHGNPNSKEQPGQQGNLEQSKQVSTVTSIKLLSQPGAEVPSKDNSQETSKDNSAINSEGQPANVSLSQKGGNSPPQEPPKEGQSSQGHQPTPQAQNASAANPGSAASSQSADQGAPKRESEAKVDVQSGDQGPSQDKPSDAGQKAPEGNREAPGQPLVDSEKTESKRDDSGKTQGDDGDKRDKPNGEEIQDKKEDDKDKDKFPDTKEPSKDHEIEVEKKDNEPQYEKHEENPGAENRNDANANHEEKVLPEDGDKDGGKEMGMKSNGDYKGYKIDDPPGERNSEEGGLRPKQPVGDSRPVQDLAGGVKQQERGDYRKPGFNRHPPAKQDLSASQSTGGFMTYFFVSIILVVAVYIIFHNRHKLFAYVIEGRKSRSRSPAGRKRSGGVNKGDYSALSTTDELGRPL